MANIGAGRVSRLKNQLKDPARRTLSPALRYIPDIIAPPIISPTSSALHPILRYLVDETRYIQNRVCHSVDYDVDTGKRIRAGINLSTVPGVSSTLLLNGGSEGNNSSDNSKIFA